VKSRTCECCHGNAFTVSECSRQDSRTVFQNIKILIAEVVLFNEEKLQNNSFLLNNTDGCTKQYRSATSIYLLTVLGVAYQIMIGRVCRVKRKE
jgi:hypothetical protein